MLKKGSLAISTNAIVVLIIAVVMLALILTLVTTGFGLIEDRFFEAISEEQDPPGPSGTQHVTINKQNIRASGGDRIGFKFAVLNVDDNPRILTVDDVHVECSPTPSPFREQEGDTIFLSSEIPSGEAAVFSYASRLSGSLTSDVYLCALRIDGARGQASFQIDRR